MQDPTVTALLLLGFTLGLRHALDADHVAAVAAMTEGGGLRRATFAGFSWGLGHATTLGLLGFALVLLRRPLGERTQHLLESAAGLMLLALGTAALVAALRGRVHVHRHRHGGEEHSHLHFHRAPHGEEDAPHAHPHPLRAALRPFLVGGVHGLAGTGAVVLVVLATIPTWLLGALYLGLFGAGSAAGMTLMSVLLAAPIVLARRRALWVHRGLRGVAGLFSLAIGARLVWVNGLAGWLTS